MTCDDCERPFDVHADGAWPAVKGYVVNRAAGGPNAVRCIEYTGGGICPDCGKLRDLGVLPGQEAMF